MITFYCVEKTSINKFLKFFESKTENYELTVQFNKCWFWDAPLCTRTFLEDSLMDASTKYFKVASLNWYKSTITLTVQMMIATRTTQKNDNCTIEEQWRLLHSYSSPKLPWSKSARGVMVETLKSDFFDIKHLETLSTTRLLLNTS